MTGFLSVGHFIRAFVTPGVAHHICEHFACIDAFGS